MAKVWTFEAVGDNCLRLDIIEIETPSLDYNLAGVNEMDAAWILAGAKAAKRLPKSTDYELKFIKAEEKGGE